MVFSFFKKQPEKMPERPAARPRAAEAQKPAAAPEAAKPAASGAPAPQGASSTGEVLKERRDELPDLDFVSAAAPAKTPSPAASPASEAAAADDGFDDDFGTWSALSITVDQDVDPLESAVEQVVVLFANGQDSAARNLLETFVYAYPGPEGKRFWLMLFDLFKVLGDRQAYDKLGVEYVHACETSPPPWHDYSAPAERGGAARSNGARKIYLQGVLTEDNPQALAELAGLVRQKAPVIVDCSKFIGCDDGIADQLTELLVLARKSKVPVSLAEYQTFLKRIDDRAVAGESGHEPVWRLLLELLQRVGSQEHFEEKAVDYAITFELSPPSWENLQSDESHKVAQVAAEKTDDAHYLSGEIKNSRFDDLVPVLEGSQHPILDFSHVSRMDFVSAGQLVNRLASYKAQGKDIVIRGPNRLIAELMAVVGLNKQFRIIVPKS